MATRKQYPPTHSILRAAHAAAEPVDRPPPPHHLGGVRPVLSARSYVAVAIFCAERVAPLVPETERADFTRTLGAARGVVLGARKLTKGVLEASVQRKRRTPTMTMARFAAVEALLALRKPDAVGGSARGAASWAVKILRAARPADVRPFLDALDAELLRQDLLTALVVRDKQPSVPVARVLHRAPALANGKVPLYLALLDDGAYGLLVKLGHRWAWTEGTRDDVGPPSPASTWKPPSPRSSRTIADC